MAAALPLFPVREALPPQPGREAERPRSLAEQLPEGRILELSGAGAKGRTTTAVSLVIRAQRRDEPVAWIQPEGGALFPPDLADSGVDLDALVVIHAPPSPGGGRRGRRGADGRGRAAAHGVARAAELLLRSGAFGLVVADLTAGAPRGPAFQGRLAGLCRQHGSVLVLLTDGKAEAPSLGPMVGVRVAPERDRRGPARFVVDPRVVKDKVGLAPAAPARHRAPWGLR